MLADFFNLDDASPLVFLPIAGVVLGIAFGALAQWSRFCFRSGIIQLQEGARAPMAGAYVIAFLTGCLGVQLLFGMGYISFEGTRFVQSALPLGPLVFGGLLFGMGMILTRGCPARLTVLAAQGNLRAAVTLMIFAIMAFASLRGVLATPRRAFAEATTVEDLAFGGALPLWLATILGVAAVLFVVRSRVTFRLAVAGVGIGAVIALGWFATGAILQDPFDPQPAESVAFTSGASDALFFVMASSALTPGFPVSMFAGVLIGAWALALVRRELRIEGFENGHQMLRYILGAVAMGVGGVWAGGCTIGAGLTGTSTLSVSAFIALASIGAGAALTNALLKKQPNSKMPAACGVGSH